METYNKGQWGKDEEYADEDVKWKGGQSEHLIFKDYEESAEIIIGDEYGFHIRIHCSEDVYGKYVFYI